MDVRDFATILRRQPKSKRTKNASSTFLHLFSTLPDSLPVPASPLHSLRRVYRLAAANPRLSNFQGHFPPFSTSLELLPPAPRSVGRSRCHLQTSSVRIPVQHRPSACPSPRWTKTELRADALRPAPLRHTRLPLQTSSHTAVAPLPPPSHMPSPDL